MQTFLPYDNMYQSLSCLDDSRLGKQRVEALQIVNAIEQGPKCLYDTVHKKYIRGANPLHYLDEIIELRTHKVRKTPWYNHPCTQMWIGYLPALKRYHDLAVQIWKNRGHKNNMQKYDVPLSLIKLPPWWGNQDFHDSHKSNLYRKDPEYYSVFSYIGPNMEYVWPSQTPKQRKKA